VTIRTQQSGQHQLTGQCSFHYILNSIQVLT